MSKNYDIMEGFLKPDRFKWHTIFNFAEINKTFTSITELIFLDAGKENIIISKEFVKLLINIGRLC